MRVGHYTLEEEIGHGGMGIVHRAVDTRLGRRVAIKVLPADATIDPDRRRRFIQEARAASALNHPHIVTIYDIGEEGETTFIAMELVDGTPLDKVLAQDPLPVSTALEYASQIASALETAHASGIIHRDIKPANIMITRDGRAKVLDFGLAKLVERTDHETTVTSMGTRAGMILGTAAYMAPEQAEGRAVDARADIFSFGTVLYEMLAGRRAFTGDSDISVMTAILRDQPPRLATVRSGVPPAVQAIVDRCLAKNPAARYESAGQLRADLLSSVATATPSTKSWWRNRAVLALAAALLVAVAVIGAWQTMQPRRSCRCMSCIPGGVAQAFRPAIGSSHRGPPRSSPDAAPPVPRVTAASPSTRPRMPPARPFGLIVERAVLDIDRPGRWLARAPSRPTRDRRHA